MLFIITSIEQCKDNFLARMCKIATSHPDRIIYRKEEMNPADYRTYAYDCQSIARLYDVPFSVDGDVKMARELKSDLQVSFQTLADNPQLTEEFHIVGVCVNSMDEAKKAQEMGAAYLVVGGIFDSECKTEGKPKGLDFLKNTTSAVQIPVLAMGGITKDKMPDIYDNGAEGVCAMSHFMKCPYDSIESDIFGLKNTDIEK